MTDFCKDEGCPHAGAIHTCLTDREVAAWWQKKHGEDCATLREIFERTLAEAEKKIDGLERRAEDRSFAKTQELNAAWTEGTLAAGDAFRAKAELLEGRITDLRDCLLMVASVLDQQVGAGNCSCDNWDTECVNCALGMDIKAVLEDTEEQP